MEQSLMSSSCNLSKHLNSIGKFLSWDPDKLIILNFFISLMDKLSSNVHCSKQSILSFNRHLMEGDNLDRWKPVKTKTFEIFHSFKKVLKYYQRWIISVYLKKFKLRTIYDFRKLVNDITMRTIFLLLCCIFRMFIKFKILYFKI